MPRSVVTFAVLASHVVYVTADGNPCSSSIDKPTTSGSLLNAMVNVMGLKKLLPSTPWPENSVSKDKDQPQPYGWVPYCESGEPKLLGAYDWGSDQTSGTGVCASGKAPVNGCCDSVGQPGPCVSKFTSDADDKDTYAYDLCVKRWDLYTMGTFATECRLSNGDAYLISAVSHKLASGKNYFTQYEDANFICIPDSSTSGCSNSNLQKHLESRAKECMDNYMTGCLYFIRPYVAVSNSKYSAAPQDRYKNQGDDMDFGYETLSKSANYFPCETVIYGAAGSMADVAGSFLDKDKKLNVNKMLSKVIEGTSFVGC